MARKMSLQYYVLLTLLILMVLLVGCSGKTGEETLPAGEETSPANNEIFTLRFISSWGQSSASWTLLSNFKKEVEVITNGKVIIDVIGGPEIFPAVDQFEAVKSGAVDGAFTAGTQYSGYIPEANAIAVTSLTVEEQIKSGGLQLLRDIHTKEGVFFLMPLDEEYAQYVFRLSKPINSVDELRGMRIRTAPGVYGEVVKACGAAPISIPAADTYSSLEQGLIEGVVSPCISGGAQGEFDFTKYIITPGWFKGGYSIIINQVAWNKIHSDVRDLLNQNIPRIADALSQTLKEERDKNWNMLADNNGEVLELSPSEAEKLEKIVSEVGWSYVKQNSPNYGAELEQKLGHKG